MHIVFHSVPQHWDFRCSAELLGVCFQTHKRGCSSEQRGMGSAGNLLPQQAVRAGSISRVKTGLDKFKDNKWETKDWAGMYSPAPLDSSRDVGEMQGESTLEGDQSPCVVSRQPHLLPPSEIEYRARRTRV